MIKFVIKFVIKIGLLEQIGDVAIAQIGHEYRRKSTTPTPTLKSEVFGLIANGNCFFALNSNQIEITEIFFKNVMFIVIFTPNHMGKTYIFVLAKKS